MKSAFSTLGCPDLTLAEVLAVGVRTGMEAVEIRLDKQDAMCGYTIESIAEAVRMIAESGLKISDLATGVSITGYDQAAVERMEKCAALAAAVGAKGIRVFTGSFSKPGEAPQDDADGIARTLLEGARVTRKHGVQVWVETHSAYSTGETVAGLLARVNDPDVRVIWDIMHSIEFGEHPKKTVEYLGDAIVHVHLKDGRDKKDGSHYQLTALGAGDVDFCEIADALETIGFDGYLSLEWELMWHPELAVCYRDTDDLLTAYRALLEKCFC
ncbi:MAG: sugar phosphate isomerase/epimerase [Clostridia bacterium]|nr:sugar phosphate isomerase/epimerase [Clostridia bacterium]